MHAIPDETRLKDGDLVSVDLALLVDGWCADAATTFTIGPASIADQALIHTAQRALTAGISAARPGARLGDVSAAIGSVIRAGGFGLLAHHGGHGIGTSMHQEPDVLNEGRPKRGLKLQPGLVIAIEPMLQAGGRDDYLHCADGWECGPPTAARQPTSSRRSRSPPPGRSSSPLDPPRPFPRRPDCRTAGPTMSVPTVRRPVAAASCGR